MRFRDSDVLDLGFGWGGGFVNFGGGFIFFIFRLGDCNGDNFGVIGGDIIFIGEVMGVVLGVGCGVFI